MSTDIKTKEEIIRENKSVERRQSKHRLFGGYDFEYLNITSAAIAMDEWAKRFAEWLMENTRPIQEKEIILYRYTDRNNETGNYSLDDIYTVFEEEMNK